jgi:hypothetical protein
MKKAHADLAIKYFMDETDSVKIQFRKRDEDDWLDCEEPMFNRSAQYREKPIKTTIWYRNYVYLEATGRAGIGIMLNRFNPCEDSAIAMNPTLMGTFASWLDEWKKYTVEEDKNESNLR